jgi:hypothetical protein
MRSTIQSDAEDQELAGIVTAAKPSADATVVEAPEVVFLSTGGGTADGDGDHTVK